MFALIFLVASFWFVVNEDNDHFFKCDSSLMTEKGLVDYVDYIAQGKGKVTHVFFCVSGQRASYDSKTWEPIWAGLNDPARSDTAMAKDGTHDRWAVNCKRLFDAGIDPYKVWIGRCREKGVSPWVSMRMNDVHMCNITNYFRHTSFYRNRRDLRLDPASGDWFLSELDYGKKEVRDYSIAQVREISERWDSDGVELDWMRFGYVFRPGHEREDAHYLDDFMRDAWKIVDAAGRRHGRKMGLAVRVPYDPMVCEKFGYNVLKWAKEGLVDVVVPDGFIRMVSDLPVAKWLRLLSGTGVRLVPGLGCETPNGTTCSHVAACRGVADSFYRQGATGVYIFNLPYHSNEKYSTDGYDPRKDFAEQLYKEGLSPDDIADKEKALPPVSHDYPAASMINCESNGHARTIAK